MTYAATNGREAATEAYAIGYEYASRARRYKLSYVDAAKAFLFFRDTLVESVVKVYNEANIPTPGKPPRCTQSMHTHSQMISSSVYYKPIASWKLQIINCANERGKIRLIVWGNPT
jgi:hypothetical protein